MFLGFLQKKLYQQLPNLLVNDLEGLEGQEDHLSQFTVNYYVVQVALGLFLLNVLF
jgi:hypothetical protein